MTDTMDITDADLDAVLSGADSDAPFGRFKNGKPRKAPRGAGGRSEIPSVPGPRKVAPRSSTPRKGQPDYAQLSRNVLQFPVMGFSVAGQVLASTGRGQLGTALSLDGMTIGLYMEQLADVGRRMAEADGSVARWLEKFGKGGAIGEGVSLAMMIGAQFMVNHGRLAAMPAAGLLEPAELYRRAQAAVGVQVPESGPGDDVPGS